MEQETKVQPNTETSNQIANEEVSTESVKAVTPEASSMEQLLEDPKEIEKAEADVEDKQDIPKKVSLADKLFGDEKVEIPADYNIEFPDGVPEEERNYVKEQFVKGGISKENAQLLTDSISKAFQDNGERLKKELNLKCDQDIQRLKKEYGPENFKVLKNRVQGVVKERGLMGETFDMFLSTVGAYDAFKFLDKLTSSVRDADYAPEAVSQKGLNSNKPISKDFMKDPEFTAKYLAEDKEAHKKMDAYAKFKANKAFTEIS
ncbi:MAG: hypothetical protein C4617_04740 [Candidatus Liberibacter europaeus]|uniref:Uncharacterized protein n=1 Tax=Candidatus Liberibacter europaeus TaxID=744859 RepID=A0A2T4VWM8_9HYPH|nr:MAG: hypothetical protein C4617_04740 [Candidatus Liberibacter europaeus]